MRKLREDEIRIATEAARWQQSLADADEQARAEFADWIKASPRHLQEFMFMEALDAAAADVDPEHTLEIATDLSGADDAAIRGSWPNLAREEMSSPRSFPHPPLRSAPLSRRRARVVGLAAAVLVCVLASGYWWVVSRNVYVTDIGEQKSLKLEDGSSVYLNTDSRVKVELSGTHRLIHLTRGEALFTVAKDPGRPFEVVTAGARIRVLGTQFNVRASGAATLVAVVDGAVQVSAAFTSPAIEREGIIELRAGDEAQVEPKRIVKAQKPNVAQAVSWRAGRLVFQEEALGQIAAEFNRYNRVPKIVIENEDAAERRYGGTFNADDPESLVRLVTRTGELEAERRGDEIVIRRRQVSDGG
jgi:transmembrane sensor